MVELRYGLRNFTRIYVSYVVTKSTRSGVHSQVYYLDAFSDTPGIVYFNQKMMFHAIVVACKLNVSLSNRMAAR